MARRRLAAVWLNAVWVVVVAVPLVAKMPLDEFRARRANLRKSLDGVLVLAAATEGRDAVFRFGQEPNFYYLTGWAQPGARLLMTASSEILFLPHHNERGELYTGKRASAEDAGVQALTGFDEVLPIERLEAELDKALNSSEKLYALAGEPVTDQLRARYPFREISDGAPLITKLRVKKSAAEIAAIQHSTDVSIEAQRAAWKRIASGAYEYQVAATLEYGFLDSGCEGPAYAPIVGSGPNSTQLHYDANDRRMDSGEVVVMDAAAECNDYASDLTRTLPVGGKFTARQREIYQIVLGAQRAAIAAVKPGARLSGEGETLTKVAQATTWMRTGRTCTAKRWANISRTASGTRWGWRSTIRTSETPLEAGMVITIEPGIYIPEENIGVRIEDVVLVTENGATVLSAALAKEPEQIEKAVVK